MPFRLQLAPLESFYEKIFHLHVLAFAPQPYSLHSLGHYTTAPVNTALLAEFQL